MPRLHEKPPHFLPGQLLKASDLNQMSRAIQREIIGGADVNVLMAGDRYIISQDVVDRYYPGELITFLVVGEKDDYLLCQQLFYGTTAQIYNPNPGTTAGVVPNTAVQAVAKPNLLQKTPWNLQTITTIVGDTVSYIWLALDLRAVIFDVAESFQQVVQPAYFVGDIIVAKFGPTGYFTDVNGNPVMAGTDGAIAVMWSDVNVAARDWSSLATAPGGPIVSLVSNICPQFVAHVVGEVPIGTINGTNTVFTLASPPLTNSEVVYSQNPTALTSYRYPRSAYTLAGSTITFTTAPVTGVTLAVDYYKNSTATDIVGIPMVRHMMAEFRNLATVSGTGLSVTACIVDPTGCCLPVPITGSGSGFVSGGVICPLPVFLGCPTGTIYPSAMYAVLTNIDAVGGDCIDNVCVPVYIDNHCDCINIVFYDPISGCSLIGSICPNNVEPSSGSTNVPGIYWYFIGARTTIFDGTNYSNAFDDGVGGTLVEAFTCNPFSLQVVVGTLSAYGRTRISISTIPCGGGGSDITSSGIGSGSGFGSGSGGGIVGPIADVLILNVTGVLLNGSAMSGSLFVPANSTLILNMTQYGDNLAVVPQFNGTNLTLVGTAAFPAGSALFPSQTTTWMMHVTVATTGPITVTMPPGSSHIIADVKYVTGLLTNTTDLTVSNSGIASMPTVTCGTLAWPSEYVNVALGLMSVVPTGVSGWDPPFIPFIVRSNAYSGQNIVQADARTITTTTAGLTAFPNMTSGLPDSWAMVLSTFK